MDNSRNFYLSGLISLSLFALLFALAITMLFSPTKKNSFGLKKDKYIYVSLLIPKTQTSVQEQKKITTPVDINNLFSDVWTKKIVQKKEIKKQINKRIIKQLQKKIRKHTNNSVQSLSEKMKILESESKKQQEESSSTASEVNEYLAKIQAIVYQYFHVPHNSEGYSVKTVIELDAFGKVLDFRVLQYCENEALNDEVDRIKQRIKNVIFPKNPKNISTRTVVILISKE